MLVDRLEGSPVKPPIRAAAAVLVSTEGGILTTWLHGATTYSASDPLESFGVVRINDKYD